MSSGKFTTGNRRNAKLNSEQVAAILAEAAEGATQGSLSRKYHISVVQVGRIVRREAHQNVTLNFYEPPSADDTVDSENRLRALMGAAPLETPKVLERLNQDIALVKARDQRVVDDLAELGIETGGEANDKA